MTEEYPQTHPKYHTTKIKNALQALMDNLRDAVKEVDDPRAEALFETSAEVLGGIKTAFSDYEARNEPAWREEE
jgi:hypothetical protein